MRWILTGVTGMLGRDLLEMLATRDSDVTGHGSAGLDITDPSAVAALVRNVDVVVNCAAFTQVDAAEEREGKAFAINATGPQLLARAAAAAGATMVQVSTDYVFDGTGVTPYPERAPVSPVSAYGRTKAAGEWAVRAECPDHYIVRTAWLYGRHGSCFPRTMARLAKERDSLSVVADEVGQPTWTKDLAAFIIRLVESRAPSGIYHGTAGGKCSWYEFTQEIVAGMGKDPRMVRATTAAEFARPAPRPGYSVLGHDASETAGIPSIGDWRERWNCARHEVLA